MSGELLVRGPRVLEVAGVGQQRARARLGTRGSAGFDSRVAQDSEHLSGSSLEESYIDEVHAERGGGFGMLGGRLVCKGLEREQLRFFESSVDDRE